MELFGWFKMIRDAYSRPSVSHQMFLYGPLNFLRSLVSESRYLLAIVPDFQRRYVELELGCLNAV
jgi:hypothetical protein